MSIVELFNWFGAEYPHVSYGMRGHALWGALTITLDFMIFGGYLLIAKTRFPGQSVQLQRPSQALPASGHKGSLEPTKKQGKGIKNQREICCRCGVTRIARR